MNAAIVCVGYADILVRALPYNRHHFNQVLVMTTPDDLATRKAALDNNARLFYTYAFTRDGAHFNKFAALEEALTECNFRRGWLCLMDADVLWPKDIRWTEHHTYGQTPLLALKYKAATFGMHAGQLCTPLRRMRPELTPCDESLWSQYPVHRNIKEWAGYSQVFHASDPVLGSPPWHQVDWKHAGGADSFFQQKWAPENRVRPPFECLHLGPAGKNWWGRGADPALTDTMWLNRRAEPGKFPGERIQ